MFIKVCLGCYDEEEHGLVTKVSRKDGDGPMDGEGEVCGCGKSKYYVYTRNECGSADGDFSHTSASLAINPCQTKTHRKLFPGIGVLPDGQLHFDSVRKYSNYLKKTGFVKHSPKVKSKGTRIA